MFGYHPYRDISQRKGVETQRLIGAVGDRTWFKFPQFWLDEGGVTLLNPVGMSLDGKAGDQQKSAIFMLHALANTNAAKGHARQHHGGPYQPVTRIYYYECKGPKEPNTLYPPVTFDSGLTRYSGSGTEKRPAYCVFAFAKPNQSACVQDGH